MPRNKVFDAITGSIGVERNVPISDLLIDKYQRAPMGDKYISDIAMCWNWDRVGRLCVADRAGKLYVVDGQQRLLAARMRGDIDTLPCIIRPSPGIEYEAVLFLDLNTGSRKPRLTESHNAGLIGRNPLDIEIEELIKSHGYRVGVHRSEANCIECIGEIRFLYKRNKTNLIKALEFCMEISDHKIHINKDILRGAYVLCANNKKLDAFGKRRLTNAGDAKIKEEMLGCKSRFGTDGGRSQARALLNIANFGRHEPNKVYLDA